MAIALDLALIWVEGPEAERFLQGMLTCDVSLLATGEDQPGLLLDGKGRIEATLVVHRDGAGAFTLAIPAGDAQRVADSFARHHVSEDADVLGPEPAAAVLTLGAPRPHPAPGEVVIRSDVPGGWLVVGDDAASIVARLDLTEGGPPDLDLARVAFGVPRVGRDLSPGGVLVQEAGLEHGHVSFTKGCYLGQESVARVAHRGKVNRRLRALRLAGPVQEGASIEHGGRRVGTVGTVVGAGALGAVALALVRVEIEPGSLVSVAGSAATVAALPLATT